MGADGGAVAGLTRQCPGRRNHRHVDKTRTDAAIAKVEHIAAQIHFLQGTQRFEYQRAGWTFAGLLEASASKCAAR